MFNSLPNFQVPDPPIARFALQNAFSLSSVVTLSFSLRSIICEVLSAKGTKLPGVKQLQVEVEDYFPFRYHYLAVVSCPFYLTIIHHIY